MPELEVPVVRQAAAGDGVADEDVDQAVVAAAEVADRSKGLIERGCATAQPLFLSPEQLALHAESRPTGILPFGMDPLPTSPCELDCL